VEHEGVRISPQRRYKEGGSYAVANLRTADGALIVADDFSEADGHAVLTFGQAQERAKAHRPAEREAKGPLTVADAMTAYLEFLKTSRKPTRTATSHNEVHIKPRLGQIVVENLRTKVIEKFRDDVAAGQAHVRTAEGKPQRFKLVDDDNEEEEIARRQSTTNRILTTLKAALNRAWRNGEVSSDQAWRRVKPFSGADSVREQYLKITEAIDGMILVSNIIAAIVVAEAN
jgi:hypothetical protein